eukprot:1157652-Pelagomonas_calceolata.AAC.21
MHGPHRPPKHTRTFPSVSLMTLSRPTHWSSCRTRSPELLTWYWCSSSVGQVGMLVLGTATHWPSATKCTKNTLCCGASGHAGAGHRHTLAICDQAHKGHVLLWGKWACWCWAPPHAGQGIHSTVRRAGMLAAQ